MLAPPVVALLRLVLVCRFRYVNTTPLSWNTSMTALNDDDDDAIVVTKTRVGQSGSKRVGLLGNNGAGMPLTLLCIATYRKGDEFLRECRRQGCRVLLLTEEKLRDAD